MGCVPVTESTSPSCISTCIIATNFPVWILSVPMAVFDISHIVLFDLNVLVTWNALLCLLFPKATICFAKDLGSVSVDCVLVSDITPTKLLQLDISIGFCSVFVGGQRNTSMLGTRFRFKYSHVQFG